jgi:hypothetical protein
VTIPIKGSPTSFTISTFDLRQTHLYKSPIRGVGVSSQSDESHPHDGLEEAGF